MGFSFNLSGNSGSGGGGLRLRGGAKKMDFGVGQKTRAELAREKAAAKAREAAGSAAAVALSRFGLGAGSGALALGALPAAAKSPAEADRPGAEAKPDLRNVFGVEEVVVDPNRGVAAKGRHSRLQAQKVNRMLAENEDLFDYDKYLEASGREQGGDADFRIATRHRGDEKESSAGLEQKKRHGLWECFSSIQNHFQCFPIILPSSFFETTLSMWKFIHLRCTWKWN